MSKHEAPEEKGQTLRERIAHLEAENERLRTGEKALREQTHRQQDILDAVPSPVFFKDANGRYTGCNAAFAATFGIEREALIGKTIYDVAPREVADKIREVDSDLLSKGGTQVYETKVVHEDNSISDFTVNKALLADSAGNAAGLVGVMTDVTEGRTAEAALRESEQRLALVLEGANLGSWDSNVQTGEETVNKRWAEMLGYSLDQIEARAEPWQALIHPDDKPRVMEAIEAHLAGRTPYYETEHRLRTRSGQWRWVLSRGRIVERDSEGRPLRAAGTHLDITERRRAQDLILAQRDLSMALIAVSNLEEALDLCLETARRVSGMDCGGVYIVDERSNVHLAVHRGLSDEFVRGASHYAPDAPQVRTVMAGKPVYQNCDQVRARNLPSLREGLRSLAVIPVLHEDRVIACFNMGSHSLDEVSPAARETLETIIRQIGSIVARLKAEQALWESEKKYRHLFEGLNDAAFLADAETGIILETNRQGEVLLGRPRDEIVGMHQSQLHPPGQAEEYRRKFAEHMAGGRAADRDAEVVGKDGTTVPVAVSATTVSIEGRRLILGLFRDITGLKRAEETLRQGERAERRFREMLTALHEVSNELTKIESFDEFCRQAIVLGRERLGFDRLGLWFLGDEPDTIRGSFGTDERGLLRDERALQIPASAENPLGQVLSRELPIFAEENAELRDAGGNVIARGPKVIAPLSDGDNVMGCLATDNLLRGRAIGPYERELLRLYAATLGHLCSRKRADEALRQSEEKYRALTENTNDVVYSADAEGILTYVGPQIARYGRTPQEALSHDLLEFVVPEDRDQVATDFRKSISTGLEFPSQFRIQGEGQTVRWVEDWGKVQRDETGKIVGITGVLRDITERKQAEKDLREARRKLTVAREAERRRLAREVHDSLGQQLIGLQLGLEAVATDLAGGIGDKAADSLRCLADGFGELIREVRTISHGLYPPTLESFGLTASLAQLAQSYAPCTQIEVKYPRTLAEVRFAPEVEIAMFRIAQEAVNNAVRHSQAETIVIDLKQRKGQVVLTVTDDGSGFDAAGAAGNGLGLTAMTERADAVGGSIHIESRPGRTRIRVNAPLA